VTETALWGVHRNLTVPFYSVSKPTRPRPPPS
jgi:hypothetical protein